MPLYRLEYGTHTDAETGEQHEPGDVFELPDATAGFLGEQVTYVGEATDETEEPETEAEPEPEATVEAEQEPATESEGETEAEATAEAADEAGAGTEAQPADILGRGGTLDTLEAALETGEWDTNAQLDALVEYEQNHKDREGSFELIGARRDDVSGTEDSAEGNTEDSAEGNTEGNTEDSADTGSGE